MKKSKKKKKIKVRKKWGKIKPVTKIFKIKKNYNRKENKKIIKDEEIL